MFSRIRQVAPMCPTTLCREQCENGLTDRFAVWVVDSGGPKEAQVQWPGGANVPSCEGTLAPPDEKNWTVRLWRRCCFMSNYSDHLFHMDMARRS